MSLFMDRMRINLYVMELQIKGGDPMRILVVDDDAFIRKLIGIHLKKRDSKHCLQVMVWKR